MSREVTSTKYLEINSAPITGWGFTVAAWGLRDVTTGVFDMVWIGDKDTIDNWFGRLRVNAGSVDAQSRGTTAVTASITGNPAANTWFHIGATFNANNSRSVWYNGGSKATNTGTANPAAPDRLSIGRTGDSTPEVSANNNLIAWVTIWDVILTDAEMARLPTSAPWEIRQTNIVRLLPCWGLHSSEIDLMGAAVIPIVGSSLKGATDPPVAIWTAIPAVDEMEVPAEVVIAGPPVGSMMMMGVGR